MTGGFYMDALITPARSLPKRGRYAVLAVTVALALMPVVVFTLIGEPVVLWFIAPPMIAAIIGLGYALWRINRKGADERVRVSVADIEVLRDGEAVWRSPTAFTRVEPMETAVCLALRGKRYRLATALSPMERVEFAAALQLAVIAAKAGSSYPRRSAKAPL
jgi:uncharacterized membrane protein